ncbi:hypothetical protein FB451DRAFT_1393782 [Mycena latifolia]|nr:hypothetical protein FB451DRAFT_1393782 [Mycena latifolia]
MRLHLSRLYCCTARGLVIAHLYLAHYTPCFWTRLRRQLLHRNTDLTGGCTSALRAFASRLHLPLLYTRLCLAPHLLPAVILARAPRAGSTQLYGCTSQSLFSSRLSHPYFARDASGFCTRPRPAGWCIAGGCTRAGSSRVRTPLYRRLSSALRAFASPLHLHAAVLRATPLAPAYPSHAAVRRAPTRGVHAARVDSDARRSSYPGLHLPLPSVHLPERDFTGRSAPTQARIGALHSVYIPPVHANIYTSALITTMRSVVCDSGQAEQLIPLAIAFISNVAFGTSALSNRSCTAVHGSVKCGHSIRFPPGFPVWIMTGSINHVLQGLALDLGSSQWATNT